MVRTTACRSGMLIGFVVVAAGSVASGQSRTWGPASLADFAVFQRCFGLTSPNAQCNEEDFTSSDIYPNGVVDRFDYHFLREGLGPGPWSIHCSYPPCEPDCLPRGQDVNVETLARIWVTCDVWPGDADRVQVIRDEEDLDALVPPDSQAVLGTVDFDTHEVIVFSTDERPWGGCWATQCFDGIVDLVDGSRAVIVGRVDDRRPVICLRLPGVDIRAAVVPRSSRPVVMFLVAGTAQEISTPICSTGP